MTCVIETRNDMDVNLFVIDVITSLLRNKHCYYSFCNLEGFALNTICIRVADSVEYSSAERFIDFSVLAARYTVLFYLPGSKPDLFTP